MVQIERERHFLTWVVDLVHTHFSSFRMESDEEESILKGITIQTQKRASLGTPTRVKRGPVDPLKRT